MSPKRDPVDGLKEHSPKCDHVPDDDITTPSADVSATAERLGIPTLPYSRRELFKVANDVLPDGNHNPDSQSDIVDDRNQVKKKSFQVDLPGDVIGKYANVTVRLMSGKDSSQFVFPVAIHKVIDETNGEFIKFEDFCSVVADLADGKLVTRGFKAMFISPKTHYGSKLNLYIEVLDEDLNEYLMNENNFSDLIVSTFAVHGRLIFKLYSPNDMMTIDSFSNKQRMLPRVMKSDHEHLNYIRTNPHQRFPTELQHPVPKKEIKRDIENMTDSEFFMADNLVREDVVIADMMKRAGPPYGDGPRTSFADLAQQPPFNRESRQTRSNISRSVNGKTTPASPVCVFDDEECLVRDASKVIPFSRESVAERVSNLETSAGIVLPKATDIPKLLKSHNVALNDDDDILVWYNRFHDFAMMLGIYLCPPNAMDKTSEMGKEWSSGCLPLAFHEKFVQSERILSYILRSPKFFPTKYKDELMLNPKPYNFLRLFIALHACPASDLSNIVVRRPAPMKLTQSLASYAYGWVQYFNNEANVNGMMYPKYRQYAYYFIDGLHAKYSPIKKFLEQDFLPHHDRVIAMKKSKL
jgi:hypothetical protein